jgi:hypothetical protein
MNRIVRNALGFGDRLVEFCEVLLNQGEVGNSRQAEIRKLAVVNPGFRIVYQGEFDGTAGDHVGALW